MTELRDVRGTVLLVEDDRAVRDLVTMTFELDGFEVVAAESVSDASAKLASIAPDLVVLDLLLPGGAGIDLLDQLRGGGASDVPVMIVSGIDSAETKVRGFRRGADDYVVKPFEPQELLARAQAILRRSTRAAAPARVLDMGDLKIDEAAREVWHEGELVETTAKEFDLISFLATHPGRVYSRHQLLRAVWQSSSEWQGEATVTEHVRRLRAKLGDRWIQTARGVGYRFERRRPAGQDAPPVVERRTADRRAERDAGERREEPAA